MTVSIYGSFHDSSNPTLSVETKRAAIQATEYYAAALRNAGLTVGSLSLTGSITYNVGPAGAQTGATDAPMEPAPAGASIDGTQAPPAAPKASGKASAPGQGKPSQ